MSDTPDQTLFCANLIASMDLSPKERFALGISLIAQVTDEMHANPSEGNPFNDASVDRQEPYKTAMSGMACFLKVIESGEGREVDPEAAGPVGDAMFREVEL